MGLPMCASEAPHAPAATTQLPASPETLAARAAIEATPVAHVVSRSADGAARFLVGGTDVTAASIPVVADAAARLHLAHNAGVLGLSQMAVENATLKSADAIPGGGSVVQFEQEVAGIPVFQSRASVVLDAARNLVSLASTLHPAATSGLEKKIAFKVSAESALSAAYGDRVGGAATASVEDMGPGNGDWRRYKLTTPAGALRVIQANGRRVLFPQGKRLVAAHQIEIVSRKAGSTENEAYRYIVAADDGRVLDTTPLTEHVAFKYRVWADPAGNHIPTDGPLADATPHPTGIPDNVNPGFVAPSLVTMEGFNKNPAGAVDPWLPATATKTTEGNNVQAYSDRDDQHKVNEAGTGDIGDGLDPADVVADINGGTASPLTFDRTYDVTKNPNATTDQIKAAVTQIFYVTNWMHDYWYDSGFNEKAGNAQASNYGRGGTEGDPLQAQGQDGADFAQKNNANMSAMSDGASPVMQMYVWNGLANRKVTTTPAVAFTDDLSVPTNGPATYNTATTPGPVDIVLANDGTAPNSDACQVPTNVAGKIALIEFDTSATNACPTVKSGGRVDNAKAGNAVGVLFINTTPGHVAGNYGGSAAAGIPVLGLTFEDGAKLKTALATGTVKGTLFRGPETGIDGTIDNAIIAHEWGHYLHHRLEQCGLKQCQSMSEGWADFNALMMVIKEGDVVAGSTYALAQYATAGFVGRASTYYGIRRSPYSTDMAKNAFTFKHIGDAAPLPTTAPILAFNASYNSEVHASGEIWAETMFEAYANLLAAGKTSAPVRTFDQTKRLMADYVVASMKATPVEATFTEQRDAILSTVWASGKKDDFAAFAKAFQKRGMGVGAVSPLGNTSDPQSGPPVTTFDDVVENFDYKGKVELAGVTVDDTGAGCDADGVLDSGETGTVTLKIKNTGWLPLTKTKAKVSTTLATVSFANKGLIDVPAMDPYAVVTVKIPVTVGDPTPAKATLPITINLADVEAFAPSVDAAYSTVINYDNKSKSSATDDVESTEDDLTAATPIWTRLHGTKTVEAWARAGDPKNHFWHGDDTASPSDESLVSPALNVAATGDFTIAFEHTFKFESDPGQASDAGPAVPTYFDGAVLEISPDGGTTWEDISKYADPGYTGTIYNDAASAQVLKGRKAYVGDLAGYPALTKVTLNLKAQLAGKTVKLRFRIGTDDAAGVEGWDIDNIAFTGITNTPFTTLVGNAQACVAPVADAGADTGTGTTKDSGVPGADSGSTGNGDTGGTTDDGCSCSTAPGSGGTTTSVAGLGLLGSVMALFARRRRSRK
jgi:MYXO-CTERM domain-containing protein